MSLHLIESTKVPTRSSRKLFGATASVLLHATLIVGVFTAASAAPALNEKIDTTDKIIYVAPPPKPVVPAHQSADKPRTATASQLTVPLPFISIPVPIDVHVGIPPINTDITMDFSSARDITRRNAGNGTGIGGEPGSGTAPGSGVMSDLQVDRQVSILSGYRTPRYPEVLRAAGVEETLNASFVVDTSGRVESGSLEIPDAKHAPFIAAVREALANARFRPAESHGRRVRQRVVQAFVFSLQRE